MTELILYKFISGLNLEYNYLERDKDVILFVNKYIIDDFMDFLSKHCSSFLDNYGIKALLKDGYIGLHMGDICEYYDIEIKNIFKK